MELRRRRRRNKDRMQERIPVPQSLIDALSCARLRQMSHAVGITEDRLYSVSTGRTAKLRRYEILAIRDYLDNRVSPFIWESELYR